MNMNAPTRSSTPRFGEDPLIVAQVLDGQLAEEIWLAGEHLDLFAACAPWLRSAARESWDKRISKAREVRDLAYSVMHDCSCDKRQ